jgi:fibronectin-binding autotransporter adhesin
VRIILKRVLLFLVLISTFSAFAAPGEFSYQGQIIKPDGQALEGSSVLFTIDLIEPGLPGSSPCVLYSEQHTLNMAGSNGVFEIEVGRGVSVSSDYAGVTTVGDALSNAGTITAVTGGCVDYTPAVNDGRQLRLTFEDGSSGPVTITQNHDIVSVPYAYSAASINGLTPADLLNSDTTASNVLTQANLVWLFEATRYSELQALINGTSTQYLSGSITSDISLGTNRITNLGAPTAGTDATNRDYVDGNVAGQTANTGTLGLPDNGKVLTWDGAAGEWVASVPTGDSTKLPLTGGTMSGPIDMGAQDITNANNVTLGGNMIASGGLSTSGTLAFYNASDYVGFQAGASPSNQIWVLPDSDGTSGQVLTTDGSGNLAWADDSAPIDTVFGRTGAVVAQASDYTAALIDNIPAGNIAATSVQGALNELDNEKLSVSGDSMTGSLTMDAENEVRFADNAGGEYVGFKAPNTVTSSYVLDLPASDGLSGQVLTTNGSGALSFTSVLTAETQSMADTYNNGSSVTVDSTDVVFNITGSNNFEIQDSGSPIFAINNSAFVGIGTDAPNDLLEVNEGNISIDKDNYLKFVSNLTGALAARVGVTASNNFLFETNGAIDTLLVSGSGIGFKDNTPDANLEINNDGSGGQDYLMLSSTENADGDVLIVNSSGYVGIGTTLPDSLLQTDGDVRIKGGQLIFESSNGSDSDIISKLGTNIIGVNTRLDANSFQFYHDTADRAGMFPTSNGVTNPEIFFRTNGLERLRIRNNGNVGIGTDSPSGQLDVNGDIRLLGSVSGYVGLQAPATAGNNIWTLPLADGATGQALITDGSGNLSWTSVGTGDGDLLNGGNSGAVVVGSNDDTLSLEANGSTAITIDGSGNVGVGTTTPGDIFEVVTGSGTAYVNDSGRMGITATPGTSVQLTASGDVFASRSFNATVGFTSKIHSSNNPSLYMAQNMPLSWMDANTITTGSADLALWRDSAGVLAQRVGTSAQESRIYNTDNGANDEFFSMGFQNNTNVFTLESEATGTGVVRDIAILGGDVGIGTIAPNVQGDYTQGRWLTVQSGTGGGGAGRPSILELVGSGNVLDGNSTAEIVFSRDGFSSLPSKITAVRNGSNSSFDLAFETLGNEKLRIKTTGEVGIGTNNPGGKLDVDGDIRMLGATSGYAGFQAPATAGNNLWTLPTGDGSSGQALVTDGSGNLSWTSVGTGDGDLLNGGNSGAVVVGSNDDTLSLEANGSTAITIDVSGYVGIGTTSPDVGLHIEGDDISSGLKLSNTTPISGNFEEFGIEFDGRSILLRQIENGVTNSQNSHLVLGTYTGKLGNGIPGTGSDRLALGWYDGRVGVGINGNTTTAGLDIANSYDATSGVAYGTRIRQTLTATANNDTLNALYIDPIFDDGTFTGVEQNSLIVASGNTGFGITSPQYQVQVAGSYNQIPMSIGGSGLFSGTGWTGLGMTGSGTASKAGILFQRGGGYGSWGRGMMIFALNNEGNGDSVDPGDARMVIDPDGQVGIGTTAPVGMLEVNGDIRLLGSASGYVGFQAPATAGNDLWTLPTGDGSSGQALVTDGSGNLSWTSVGIGDGDLLNGGNSGAVVVGSNDNSLQLEAFGSSALYINASSNVGIGVPNPVVPLQVSGQILGSSINSPQYYVNGSTGFQSSGSRLMIGSGGAWTQTSLYAGSGNEVLRANSSGYVGIGSTTPNHTLDILGTMELTSTGTNAGNGKIQLGAAGNNNRPILGMGPSGDGDEFRIVNAGDWRVGTANSSNFSLITDNTVRMTMNSSGININGGLPLRLRDSSGGEYAELNVPNIASNYSLTLPPDAGSAGQVLRTDGSGTLTWITPATGTGDLLNGGNSGAVVVGSNDDTLSLEANGSTAMRIDASGFVGIGTNSPVRKLEVRATANDPAARFGYNSGSGGIEIFGNSLSQTYIHFGDTAGNTNNGSITYRNTSNATRPNSMDFRTAQAVQMTIDASGNVGVGTTLPESRLHIVGDQRIEEGHIYLQAAADSGIYNDGQERIRFGSGYTNIVNVPLRLLNQELYGSTDVNGNLVLRSTSNASKGDVLLSDNGGGVAIGTTSAAGVLDVNGDIRMLGSASGYVGFQAPATAGNNVWTLPTGDGTSGQALVTDGSGNLSWASGGADNLGNHSATTQLDLAGYGIRAVDVGNVTFPSLSFFNDINTGLYSPGADTFGLVTGGTERMRIDASGFVGIGTNAPGDNFHVFSNSNTTLDIESGNGWNASLEFEENGTRRWRIYNEGAGDELQFVNTSASKILTLLQTGEVGIGTETPADTLDVDGDIRVGTSGSNGCLKNNSGGTISGTCSSDRRFKKDIQPMESVVDRFAKLSPSTYYWRADEFPDKAFGDTQQLGLIAQELKEVFPDLVVEDEDGYLRVNYTDLNMYFMKAFIEHYNRWVDFKIAQQQKDQEQDRAISSVQERLDEKDQEIERLKKHNESLEKRLDRLEKALLEK